MPFSLVSLAQNAPVLSVVQIMQPHVMLTFASHYVQDPNQTHRLLSLTHNAATSKNSNFQNAFFDYNDLPPHALIASRLPLAPQWPRHPCLAPRGCLGPCPGPFLPFPLSLPDIANLVSAASLPPSSFGNMSFLSPAFLRVLLRHKSHTIQFTNVKYTIKWFLVYSQYVQPSLQSVLEYFHHLKKKPLYPLASIPLPSHSSQP